MFKVFWREPAPTVRVVEVDRGQRVPPLDADIAKSIQALQGHPGFLYLLAKLKFHRSVLRDQLATTRQPAMSDVLMLQSGVAWSGWLQNELETAIAFRAAAPVAPSRDERTIFEEAQRQLEVLR